MGKAARKTKPGGKEQKLPPAARSVPNKPLLGLAAVGMGLTAYLTWTAWTGQIVAGCSEGSGCDIVLSSRWSMLFSLPTSFWGLVAYGGLAGIAFIRRREMQWKLAWGVSLFGVLFSLYLTLVSFVELQAACPYCLTSLGLMAAILGITAYQWPKEARRFSWTGWLPRTVLGGLALVLALHLYYIGGSGQTTIPAQGSKAESLVSHLAATGAKFYGAYWCPHCDEQKKLFGSAAGRLPYVECSPLGRGAPQASICRTMNIRTYPTWIIQGRRYEGVLTLKELAEYSQLKG